MKFTSLKWWHAFLFWVEGTSIQTKRSFKDYSMKSRVILEAHETVIIANIQNTNTHKSTFSSKMHFTHSIFCKIFRTTRTVSRFRRSHKCLSRSISFVPCCQCLRLFSWTVVVSLIVRNHDWISIRCHQVQSSRCHHRQHHRNTRWLNIPAKTTSMNTMKTVMLWRSGICFFSSFCRSNNEIFLGL